MTTNVTHRLIGVLALGLAIRLIVLLVFQPWDPAVQARLVVVHDAVEYDRLARCILEELTFCGNTFRTPGYPAFVALVYALAGVKPWVVLCVQAVLGLVTLYFVFRTGALLHAPRTGLVAAALLAIEPMQILSVTMLLSDTLFLALLVPGIYFYLLGLEKNRTGALVAAGVLLAAATLTRPVAQYYILVLAGLVLLWRARPFGWRIKQGAAFLFAVIVALAPWIYRNVASYDTPGISSIQGENLLFWQVAYAKAWQTKESPVAIQEQFLARARGLGYDKAGNPFVNEAIAHRLALDYIRANEATFLKRWAIGVLHTFTNLHTSTISQRLGLPETQMPPGALYSATSEGELVLQFLRTKSGPEIAAGAWVLSLLAISYTLFALGAAMLAKRRRWWLLGFALLTVAYFAVTGGVIGQARFRMPVMPFVFLLAAMYVDDWLRRRASRHERRG